MILTPSAREDRVCVTYHCWGHAGEPSPWLNLRTPVVASIATLRGVAPHIPVVVLDISEQTQEWGLWPGRLNFTVVRTTPFTFKYRHRVAGWQHLSRLFDLRRHTFGQQTVLYVDSDVFFAKCPLPLSVMPDRFCFNGWNSGIFYYPHGRCEDFFDVFESYTLAAIYSPEFRQLLRKYISYDAWYGVWDEMSLTYICRHNQGLIRTIAPEEHATTFTLGEGCSCKIFHSNGTMVANPLTGEAHARGLLCLLVKEFYDNAIRALGEDGMANLFPASLRNWCLPRQFSLSKDLPHLLATRDANGHYHATAASNLSRTTTPDDLS